VLNRGHNRCALTLIDIVKHDPNPSIGSGNLLHQDLTAAIRRAIIDIQNLKVEWDTQYAFVNFQQRCQLIKDGNGYR
jgi:hypothetical protein